MRFWLLFIFSLCFGLGVQAVQDQGDSVSLSIEITDQVIVSGTSVLLTWDLLDQQADGYNVYRSTRSGGGYTLVGYVDDSNCAMYLDVGLVKGTKYYYVVTTVSLLAGESAFSSEVTATL